MAHQAVLLKETIEGLDPKSGEVYVDATLGAGGHSLEVFKRSPQTKIIGLDADGEALERTRDRLEQTGSKATLIQSNFRNLETVLREAGVYVADKILFDLGTSTDQLGESGRGFSFQNNEPLLMTLSDKLDSNTLTAKRIVNEWSEEQIATILDGYGEERFAKRIAKGIIEARDEKTIETTFELVAVIKEATPYWYHHRKLHPATKTFQALRIAVNDELSALEEGLANGFKILSSGGRMAVITFHSLEDRIVKRQFLAWEKLGGGKRLNKKPIIPTEVEIKTNPKARSAKLRLIEKK